MKKKTVIIIFSVLIGITLVLCGTVLFLYRSGLDSMKTVAAPTINNTDPPPSADIVMDGASSANDEVLDAYTIRYNGRLYRYNGQTVNLLFMGIDNDAPDIEDGKYAAAVQADVIILGVMDRKNNKLTLISLSRDTMCSFERFNAEGQSLGMTEAQLALSFAYGDGGTKSCEFCAEAVSRIFKGLQIHGYGALYMDGLEIINDAVGGVEVTILDDYNYRDWTMTKGATVRLTGAQARKYIVSREHTLDGNLERMERQKQYLTALMSQTRSALKSDPTKILSIYSAASDYIVTDLSVSDLTYLAAQALDMSFDSEVRNVEGEVIQNENHAEYYIDDDKLMELMLDVFYEEVE